MPANTDDIHEITDLIYSYAEYIDGGDFEGVAHLFEHAAIRSGEYSFSGYDTLLSLWRDTVRIYEDGRPSTKHVITNVVVEVAPEGLTAKARSYVTVHQARPPNLPLQVIVSARHHDAFEKVDDVWRFTERVDITDLVGDMSWHTTTPYSAAEPTS